MRLTLRERFWCWLNGICTRHGSEERLYLNVYRCPDCVAEQKAAFDVRRAAIAAKLKENAA